MISPESVALILSGVALSLLFSIGVYAIRKGRWDLFSKVEAPIADRMRALTLNLVESTLRISELEVGTAQNIAQMRAAGLTPAFKLSQVRSAPPLIKTPTGTFHALLSEKFNKAELDELAFEMGFTGDYNGDTMHERALALMKYADRRGLLVQLSVKVEELRPNVEGGWPDIISLTEGMTK